MNKFITDKHLMQNILIFSDLHKNQQNICFPILIKKQIFPYFLHYIIDKNNCNLN